MYGSVPNVPYNLKIYPNSSDQSVASFIKNRLIFYLNLNSDVLEENQFHGFYNYNNNLTIPV